MLRRKHSAFGLLALPPWVNQEWLFHFHPTTYCIAGCLSKFHWPASPEVSHYITTIIRAKTQSSVRVLWNCLITNLKERSAPLLKVILPAVIFKSPVYPLLLCFINHNTLLLLPGLFIMRIHPWQSAANKWIYLEVFRGCWISSKMYWWLFLNSMCLNFDRKLFQVSLLRVSLLNPPFGIWLKHQSFLRALANWH